jgi:hypothetical protein
VTARPAFELADVFRRHGESYERASAGHLGRVERRVIGAIMACRTARLGGHVERCDDCGLTRIAYNSCRNRHCPKCQGAARAEWLAARQAEAPLAEAAAFAERLRALRDSPFVIYAKPPFGGPERVLAYLARYTHRTRDRQRELALSQEPRLSVVS